MNFETLEVSREGGVTLVTISRPEALNALTLQVLEELSFAFEDIDDDDETRAVVLTGAGDKAFVAGADIKEMSGFHAVDARAYSDAGQGVLNRIEVLGKPVIAAVNGFALGGGCELAMACHLRIASEKARFGQPEVKLGVIPGFGGSQRLPRLVGMGRALELMLTGDMIPAEEAYRIGLVNKVVPHDTLREEALAIAGTIASQAPLALRWILEAALQGEGRSTADGCDIEANLFGLCFSTEDQKEGMAAFVEKRAPKFQGK